MADGASNTERFVLDLDSKAFVREAIDAKAAISKLGDAESLVGLTEGLLSAGLAVGALGAAMYAWKTGFEAVLEAENIRMVSAQFDDLAKKAGLFSNELVEGLQEASKGWVDDTELMKHANKALLELQVGFEKLPEIMEIAKQRSQVFGGSIVSTFDAINHAVATGTTRQLRNLGIIIDQEKAYRDYANSIGVTVDSLSMAGKQQAILNALLDDHKSKMFDSHEELLKVTGEWERFKVHVNQVKEAFILFFHDAIVPVGEGLLKIVNWYIEAPKRFADWNIQLLKNIGLIKEKTKGMGDLLQAQRKFDVHREEVDKKSSVDLDKQKKQRSEFNTEIAKLDMELLREQGRNLQTVEEATAHYHANLAAEGQKVQVMIDEVKAKRAAGTITAAQADAEIVRLNKLKNLRMKADDADLYKEQSKALDNYVKHSQGAFDAVGRSFKKASLEAKRDIQTGMKIGETAVASFGKHATSSIEAWGAGTKHGTDAIAEMFAGMAGDMASQYGQMMMLASIWPPNPVAFTAGAALVALGGFLKSRANETGQFAPDHGGESPKDPPPVTTSTSVQGPTSQAATQAQQQKSMTLVIQGHVLSGDQTARWLVDKIRESADVTDFKVQSVGGGL